MTFAIQFTPYKNLINLQPMNNVLLQDGFKVKGWLSNQPLKKSKDQEDPVIKLQQGAMEEKILGTIWNHSADVFCSMSINWKRSS